MNAETKAKLIATATQVEGWVDAALVKLAASGTAEWVILIWTLAAVGFGFYIGHK